MDKKNYIDGNKIVNTDLFGRVDIFEIVNEVPCGYEVWPIGRDNFPFPGYVPLGKFEDFHMVKGCQLKALKLEEELADLILWEASKRGVDWDKLTDIIKDGGKTILEKKKAQEERRKEKLSELRLKFVGIDDWNRPVFKRDDKKQYFGDTDNLFDWSATKEEVLSLYEGKDLHRFICYFGTSFGCEPSGVEIKKDIKIILE